MIPSSELARLLQSCIDKKAYGAGKILHALVLRLGLFDDTYISNRLVEMYSKCSQSVNARWMFDRMSLRNIYSWHAMLNAYCKENQINDAMDLFLQMSERNSVSWNTMISALVQNGFERTALEFYRVMRLEGFLPTRFTFASVLRASGNLEDGIYGRDCHVLSTKLGLDTNIYVGNALVGMYAKCGSADEVLNAFGDLVEPNEVSYTALMGKLAKTDRVQEAWDVFRLMITTGTKIDSVSISTILTICAKVASGKLELIRENDLERRNMHGKQIHGLVIKMGFQGNLHVDNSLLDMYAKNGEMESAEMVFTNLSDVSVVSWNIMIGGFGQMHRMGRVFQYLKMMENDGFQADDVTYINVLVACIKCEDIITARSIFDRMPSPSLSSWNAMLSGYMQNENHWEAVELFREMQLKNVKADRTTFAIIFSSCAALERLEFGKQAHAVSIKASFDSDTYVTSGTISMYFKCSQITYANHVFTGFHQLDIACWNSTVAGLAYNCLDEEALSLFIEMLRKDVNPTEYSYATVISCSAKLSSLPLGRQVHGRTLKDGYTNDVFVGSSLVDMYCKCGDVDAARKSFDMMLHKSAVTWNEMLHGYAKNGHGEEAVELYFQMVKSSAKPDDATFVAVLTGCSHSGLVDEGIQIFYSMEEQHGVVPLLDHYTSIIDSLGRAGRFIELEVVIDKMPYKDDPIVWEVLLSSCRIHSNVTLARRAADELFNLDPKNSAPYLLLANIYASMGRWDEANDIRNMMIERQVTKSPGYSWVEQRKPTACLDV